MLLFKTKSNTDDGFKTQIRIRIFLDVETLHLQMNMFL